MRRLSYRLGRDVEEEEVDNADKVREEDRLKKNKTKTGRHLNGYLVFRIALIFHNLLIKLFKTKN